MGNLSGLSAKTVISGLEIVSEDGQFVLVIRQRSNADSGVELMVRRADEAYAANRPVFIVEPADRTAVVAAITGADLGWDRNIIDRITTRRYTPPEPTTLDAPVPEPAQA